MFSSLTSFPVEEYILTDAMVFVKLLKVIVQLSEKGFGAALIICNPFNLFSKLLKMDINI